MSDENKKDSTHVVVSKKLAEALVEAGMQPMFFGGMSSPLGAIAGAVAGGGGGGGGGPLGQLGGMLGIRQPRGGAPVGGLPGQIMGYNQFSADAPNLQMQDFRPDIKGAQTEHKNVFQEQRNLANMLMNQAQGRGPSVAQAQLGQATGQNIAAQQSMMAGQRGARQNPALMARQAAMQGAGIQQQAAGQAATMRAQEQLGAMQGLGGQQAQMAAQQLQQQSILQGGLAAQNNAVNQGQLGAQTINANVYGQNAQQSGNIFGGIMNAIGGGMGGGMFADGGSVGPSLTPYQQLASKDMSGKDDGGKGLKNLPSQLMAGGPMDAGGLTGGAPMMLPAAQGGSIPFNQMIGGGHVPGQAQVAGDSLKNDVVPTLLSPGEVVLPRSVTQSPNMEERAVEFLRHLRTRGPKGYGKVVRAKNCGGRV